VGFFGLIFLILIVLFCASVLLVVFLAIGFLVLPKSEDRFAKALRIGLFPATLVIVGSTFSGIGHALICERLQISSGIFDTEFVPLSDACVLTRIDGSEQPHYISGCSMHETILRVGETSSHYILENEAKNWYSLNRKTGNYNMYLNKEDLESALKSEKTPTEPASIFMERKRRELYGNSRYYLFSISMLLALPCAVFIFKKI